MSDGEREDGMERIRLCLACGELAPFGERTCPACGHHEPIEGLRPCPGCAREVPDELIYCPRCGLDRAPQPERRPVAPSSRWAGADATGWVDHLALGLTLLGPLVLALAVAAVAVVGR